MKISTYERLHPKRSAPQAQIETLSREARAGTARRPATIFAIGVPMYLSSYENVKIGK